MTLSTFSPIDGDSIRGTSPADGKALTPVVVTSSSAVDEIVKSARAAQSVHAARTVEARVALVRRYADALMARAADLEAALMSECGKVLVEARMVEVLAVADLCAYWCDEGAHHLRPSEVDLDPMTYPGKRAVVERLPRGVIALITPWNFPVALPLRTLFPALIAGNAVVFKPSEWAPRSGAILAEEASKIFGEGLVGLVQGGGDIAQKLIGAVDAVVFTGSVSTGRKVAHAAAEALIPAGVELGGKDAAIVLDDAQLERTAQGLVWAAFANAGQNCAAVERVYVTSGIAKALRDRMIEITKTLVLGRDIPPLTTPAQLALVESHVNAAVAAGATVATGGKRAERDGLYFEPTILENVPSTAAAVVDETFGPIVPIIEVPDEEAAIREANSSRYGLTASVWTSDLARGERVARRLRAGVITVNNHSFTGAVPALPWTGVGETGYGITNSAFALDLLTRPRTLLIDASRQKRELWWYPYTPALANIASGLIDARRGGVSLGTKLSAVGKLLGGMAKRWKV